MITIHIGKSIEQVESYLGRKMSHADIFCTGPTEMQGSASCNYVFHPDWKKGPMGKFSNSILGECAIRAIHGAVVEFLSENS